MIEKWMLRTHSLLSPFLHVAGLQPNATSDSPSHPHLDTAVHASRVSRQRTRCALVLIADPMGDFPS